MEKEIRKNNKLIYFVNPKDEFLLNSGDRPPLGLAYLSSYCKEVLKMETKIWDLNHDVLHNLIHRMRIDKPNYVCIGISTPNYKQCIELSKKIKTLSNNKTMPIMIAGGNHITDNPNEQTSLLNFDYLVVGDGEEALARIIKEEPNYKLVISKPIENIDELPFPDYEGLKLERYYMRTLGKKSIVVVSSRGCLFSCCYCGSAKIKKWRPRSPENFVDELKILYKDYNIESFYFGDDIYTFDKKRTIDICNLISKYLPTITYRATTRSSLLDEEMIIALKKSGCEIVCLGMESGDAEVLKASNKGMSPKINEEVTRLCKKHGLKIKGFFIIGLPGSDYEKELNSIAFAKKLQLDYVDFYPLTPYPGTPLWDDPSKFNMSIIKPKEGDTNWDDYFQVGKDGAPKDMKIEHPNLTHKQIRELLEISKRELKGGLTYE